MKTLKIAVCYWLFGVLFLQGTAALADYLDRVPVGDALGFVADNEACGCKLTQDNANPASPINFVNCSACEAAACRSAFGELIEKQHALSAADKFPLGALEGNDAALSDPDFAACIPVVSGGSWSWSHPWKDKDGNPVDVPADGLQEVKCLIKAVRRDLEASDYSKIAGPSVDACGILSGDRGALDAAFGSASDASAKDRQDRQRAANLIRSRVAIYNSCCEARLGFDLAHKNSCVDQQMHNLHPQYSTALDRLTSILLRDNLARFMVTGCKDDDTIREAYENSLKRLNAKMVSSYVDGLRGRQSRAAAAAGSHPVIRIALSAPAQHPATGTAPGAPGARGAITASVFARRDLPEEVKCDEVSQRRYLELVRDRSPLNQPERIEGWQSRYFCKVKQRFSDFDPALFLARLGMRASTGAKAVRTYMMSGTIISACSTLRSARQEAYEDLKLLARTDHSPELAALEKDLQAYSAKSCDELMALALESTPAAQTTERELDGHLCAWIKQVEQSRPGSTAGFTGALLSCRGR